MSDFNNIFYQHSIFKQDFCLESYLLRVDKQHRDVITKFRVSNMKLPIETGRWYNISKDHKSVQNVQKI